MDTNNRRQFLKSAGFSAGALGLLGQAALAQAPAVPMQKSAMHLGLVTYNLAADWDIATIIKNCEASGFDGVELRTSHAHKVESNLGQSERAEVKKRFHNSKVELMGLGSIFDYHTPDQAQLRKDIEATRQYIVLAQDVGASGVKVRPNAFPKNVPQEKTLEQIGRSLGELGDFARDHGQVIRLEVHGAGTSLVPHIKTILDVANHKSVGACWNCNPTDLDGDGWDKNFNLLRDRIFLVHMHDLYQAEYPYPKLMARLKEIGYKGNCLAEIDATLDPVRLMKYYRSLWLAQQGLL